MVYIPLKNSSVRTNTWRSSRDDVALTRDSSLVPKQHITLENLAPVGEPRPVPGALAPLECLSIESSVARDCVVLVGRDLKGHVRVKVELSRVDASSWWGKVIRLWLAWRYGCAKIRLLG